MYLRINNKNCSCFTCGRVHKYATNQCVPIEFENQLAEEVVNGPMSDWVSLDEVTVLYTIPHDRKLGLIGNCDIPFWAVL